MKKKILTWVLALIGFVGATAQVNNQADDRLALKNLVDTFSVLADFKDTQTQQMLFTEDAEMISFVNGKMTSDLKGRKNIGDACANYLSLFDTVYHLNGQQTVNIEGDHASGISYCFVTLIGMNNGKRMKNQSGVRYRDEYVKINGRWFIKKRMSDFMWTTSEEMK